MSFSAPKRKFFRFRYFHGIVFVKATGTDRQAFDHIRKGIEAQIAQRIGPQHPTDLFHRTSVGNQLASGRNIGAEVAGITEGR